MRKAKFDKFKCYKCKYHGMGVGYSIRVNGKVLKVHCNYCGINKSSCLRKQEDGTVIDIRGNDFSNCKLFEEGEMIKSVEEIWAEQGAIE